MNAKWIGFNSDTVHTNVDVGDVFGCYAQYYRKAFTLKEKPIQATVKLSALGIFVAFINGKKVSNDYFAPGWTNYSKTLLYREYDITSLLETNNAISLCVGDGWYAGFLSIRGRFRYGNYPLAMFAEMTITFADGSTQKIVSDDSWKAGLGAIRENDFLGGEIYDSRLLHSEISLPDFDDSSWDKVFYTEDHSDKLIDFKYEPVIEHEILDSTLVSKNGNVYIYDMGQNFAGVVRLTAKGVSGTEIVIRHAEILDDDGNIYTENLRLAKATDTLILNGDIFEYTPTMTSHGFRFVEITLPEGAEIISLKGVVLYSDVQFKGDVITSHPITNKLISNVKWGMKSNFIDLPTDCPQRNERLGWTGDTQVFVPTANYFANCNQFYKKQFINIVDDTENGIIPDVVPFFGVGAKDSTGWRDVGVILPYYLWTFYGEKDYALSCLPLIDSMLERQKQTAVDFTWEKANYNDWLNVDEDVNPSVLTGLSNAHCFMLAAKLKAQLGVDNSKELEYFESIKKVFAQKFIDKDERILGDTQTAYALAYRVGFISKESAKKYLIEAFNKRNNHIHSGFVGIRFILPVLCELGLTDLAYDLITKTTYPSWGYSIVNGATTIWERWDSYTKEKGLQIAGMNSFNHYAFGTCAEWMFEYMLGIKPVEPGFKKIQIRPYVDKSGKLTSAKGHYESINGKISVCWERKEDGYVCIIEKPKDIDAEFIFENVTKIVQDGVVRNNFDNFATTTAVYFNA